MISGKRLSPRIGRFRSDSLIFRCSMFTSDSQDESYGSRIEGTLRDDLINKVMVAWTLVGVVVFIFTQIRALGTGLTPRDTLHFIFLCIAIVITVYREHISATHKALVLVVMSSLAGIGGVYAMGMFSGGIFYIVMAAIITVLFFSRRVAIASGILFTVIVGVMGVAFSTGVITLRPMILEMHTNLLHWGVYVCCFGIMLVFSCGAILSYRCLMNKMFRDETEELYGQFEDTMGRANAFQVKAEVMRLEFKQVFSAIDDGAWIIDNDKRVLRINASLLAFLGIKDEADVIGRRCHEVINADICLTAECPLNRAGKGNGRTEHDLEITGAENKKIPFLFTSTPLLGLVNEQVGIIEQFKDITERKHYEDALKKANSELQRMATIDGLTQVANRRHFEETLSREWSRMRREGQPLSLILSDVDFFKRYNDHYGHPAGDECLQSVAQCMQRCIHRTSDFIARYGGEEFAVILPNTDSHGAAVVAENIRREIFSMKREHLGSGVSQYLTMSFGVATVIPTSGGDAALEQLVKTADDALYASKGANRNCVTVTDLDGSSETEPENLFDLLLAEDEAVQNSSVSEAASQ
jgi:diguanylate cyclase (GGDEF)-like protein/PAS domain S-box-containing protein